MKRYSESSFILQFFFFVPCCFFHISRQHFLLLQTHRTGIYIIWFYFSTASSSSAYMPRAEQRTSEWFFAFHSCCLPVIVSTKINFLGKVFNDSNPRSNFSQLRSEISLRSLACKRLRKRLFTEPEHQICWYFRAQAHKANVRKVQSQRSESWSALNWCSRRLRVFSNCYDPIFLIWMGDEVGFEI